MRLSVRVHAQNALFRHVAAPGRCGATPPARLRGTMENGSTGQMRSSNPPPACGAGCAGVRRSRFGVWPHGKAHSARPAGFRMRFSVECAFPHLGKRRATSRKSALCSRRNRNSVHKCPRTAPRGRSRRSVYTPLSPRLSTTAHLTERHTLHSPLDRGETKKRILLQRLTKNRSLVSPGVVECAFP